MCHCVQPRDDGFESRASLFQQNAPLADPCTFRLIAKNVTNLLRDTGAEASQKAAALTSLEALLRCAMNNTTTMMRPAHAAEPCVPVGKSPAPKAR